ncbi:hypothetical protein O3M35_011248 [Rhynocoris fuscipes]|uniref:t-SNARE coiled-coil homology domain-containing protein n=1 Tax=Rhynocoris fuscipes TaxID=488301 RepID=A0AAW1CV12_9HEMI
MALIPDIGSDPWLISHESCEKLYREIVKELNQRNLYPKTSVKFSEISVVARMKLKQFSHEVNELSNALSNSHSLTSQEEERRERLVEDLQSKYIHLLNMHKSSGLESSEGASSNWFDHDDSDVPLLGQDENVTVHSLKEQQKKILAEQDRGLENLSAIISRQKNISIAINNEVDLHNEIIDDIGTRMDSTNTNISRETTAVSFIAKRDNTCGELYLIFLRFTQGIPTVPPDTPLAEVIVHSLSIQRSWSD